MDDKQKQNDKAAFGLLPMILLLISPIICVIGDNLTAWMIIVIAVSILSYGLLTGKVKLFG